MALALRNNRETIEYRVKSGENLAGIAKKFHMSTSELKSLNSLKKNYVRPKQHLLVYNGPAKSKFPESLAPSNSLPAVTRAEPAKEIPPSPSTSPVVYTVKQGECLALIAQKHGCTVENLMTWNSPKQFPVQPARPQNLFQSQKPNISGTPFNLVIIFGILRKDMMQRYPGLKH
jgi:LysM repeat protein